MSFDEQGGYHHDGMFWPRPRRSEQPQAWYSADFASHVHGMHQAANHVNEALTGMAASVNVLLSHLYGRIANDAERLADQDCKIKQYETIVHDHQEKHADLKERLAEVHSYKQVLMMENEALQDQNKLLKAATPLELDNASKTIDRLETTMSQLEYNIHAEMECKQWRKAQLVSAHADMKLYRTYVNVSSVRLAEIAEEARLDLKKAQAALAESHADIKKAHAAIAEMQAGDECFEMAMAEGDKEIRKLHSEVDRLKAEIKSKDSLNAKLVEKLKCERAENKSKQYDVALQRAQDAAGAVLKEEKAALLARFTAEFNSAKQKYEARMADNNSMLCRVCGTIH
jgi:chromosome segregation ATPase